ncbi:MAG: hypothetical protein COA79_23385 [Planctomycetota bacterium]|nr:MAG: hypothetical protein COA79_23385 [Planctomycetota bacterium]
MLKKLLSSLFIAILVFGCGSDGTYSDGSFELANGSSDGSSSGSNDALLKSLSVSGIIIDSTTGNAVSNANVTSGDTTVTSDENGSFLISVDSTTGEVPLDIDANGFSSNQKLIKGVPDDGSYVEVNLKSSELVNFDLISIASSGKKGKDDGLATLNIVRADGVGERELIPGDLKTSDGSLLEPLGAFELILRDGNQAVVSPAPAGFEYTALIEVPTILQDEYRNNIGVGDILVPLWQYSETTGGWSQDENNQFGGVVEVDGVIFFSATVTNVGWFGFFNTIAKLSCIKGLVLDGADKGLANIEVVAEGVDYQGVNSARTDSNGVFSMLMKSGSTVKIFYRYGGVKQEVNIVHLQDYAHDEGSAAANAFCQPTGPKDSADPLYITHPSLSNHLPPSATFESENNTEFPLILRLQPVVVSGKVVDSQGAGIANAKVQTSLGVGIKSSTTGDYSIKFLNLGVDSLKIRASTIISGFVVSDETVVTIAQGSSSASATNLVLDATSIVKYTGTISGPDKLPVSGAIVVIENGQSALTDVNGVYTIFEKNSLLTNGSVAGVNGVLSSSILVKAILRNSNGDDLCIGRSLTGAMIDNSSGKNIATINLQICRSAVPVVAQVEGVVKDSTGALLASVDVIPSIDGILQVAKKTQTDSSGKYKFDVPAESGSKYKLGVLAKFTEFQQTVSTSKTTVVLFESNADDKAFSFDSQWSLASEDNTKANSLGLSEKWLVATNGFSFVILPSGSVSPSNDSGNSLFSLDSKFYDDVNLILNAIDPGVSTTSVVVTFNDLIIERPAQPTLFKGVVKVNGSLRPGVKVKAIGLAAPEITTDDNGGFNISISSGETFTPGFFLGGSRLSTDLISAVSTGGTIDLGTIEATLDVPQPFIISVRVINPNGKPSAKAIAGAGKNFTLQLVVRGVFSAPTVVFSDSLVTEGTKSTSDSEVRITYSYPADKVGFFILKYEIQETTSEKLTGSFFLNVVSENKPPFISDIVASGVKIGQTDATGVSIGVKAFDPEGGTLTYLWSLDASSVSTGVTIENSSSDKITVKTSSATVGDIILKVVVTDEANATATDKVTVRVINLPPTILEFRASPSSTIAENDLITITLESEDPNGGITKVAFVDWGDGSAVEIVDQDALNLANGNKKTLKENFSFTHTYTKEDQYTVSILVVGPGGKAVIVKKTISVIKSYEKPVLKNDVLIVDEDKIGSIDLITLLTNASAGSLYTFRVSGRPVNGFAKIVNNKLEFTPIPNFNGSDSLKLIVNDGFSDSAENTVAITVKSVADAPVLQGTLIQAQVPLGSSWTFNSDKVTDPDANSVFSFTVSDFAGYGSVSASGSSLVFSATGPDISQDATSSFKFSVSDGGLSSNVLAVQITVLAPSVDIVVSDATFSTVQDTPGNFDLSAFVSGSANLTNITIEILKTEFDNLTTINGKIITFTPPFGQTGSFTTRYLVKKFTINGFLSSNIANITVNVTAPPIVLSITSTPPLSVDRGVAYSYTLQVTSAGSSAVSLTAPTLPTWLTFVGGILSGTPKKGDIRSHIVRLSASSGGVTVQQNFAIVVNLVNAAPVISSISNVPTSEEVAVTVTVNFTDADADDLNHLITVTSSKSEIAVGTVSGTVTGSTFTLTPETNFSGTATITVKVKDALGSESLTTFLLTVSNSADAPVLSIPPNVFIQTSGSASVGITFFDPDGPAGLTWNASSSNGLIIISPLTGTTSGDLLLISPVGAFTGTGAINVTISDGGLSNTSTMIANVGQLNNAPIITLGTSSVNGTEDILLNLSGEVSFTDADATSSLLNLYLQTDHGTLTLPGTPSISFLSGDGLNDVMMTLQGSVAVLNSVISSINLNPEPNYNGTVKVRVSVNDLGNSGLGGPKTAFKEIIVNIAAVNDPPSLATINSFTMSEGGSQNVTIDGSDVDIGDTFTWVASSSVAQISLSPSSGTSDTTMTITGAPGHNGTSTVNITINDGSLTTGIGFAIYVTPNNQMPTIVLGDQFPNITEDGALSIYEDIAINDSDAGSGILEVQLNTPNGKLTMNGTKSVSFQVGDGQDDSYMKFTGTLTQIGDSILDLGYEPNPDFYGTDPISIIVNDQGNTGPGGPMVTRATISVNVIPINDPPMIDTGNNFRSILAGKTMTISSISVNDADALTGILNVDIEVRHGLLSLGSVAGLATFTANGSSAIHITGTLSNLNNAIATLSYQANSGFHGVDAMAILVEDNGNTGGGNEFAKSVIIIQISNPIFVNHAAAGSNDGTSWTNAFNKLSDAMVATGSSNVLWVAQGVYKPGNTRSSSFLINKHMEIYGGFNGTEKYLDKSDPVVNLTYLSGEIQEDGTKDNNAFHVVKVVSSGMGSVLSGFIIKEGCANGAGDTLKGAGVYVVNSSLDLERCTIMENKAGNTGAGGGGGVFSQNSELYISDCFFVDNTSKNKGGGLFIKNGSVEIENSVFTGNATVESGSEGGAIYNESTSSVLSFTTFYNNNSIGSGGGFFNGATSSGYNIYGCIFHNNSSQFGDVNSPATPSVLNCVVQGGLSGGVNILDVNPGFANTSDLNGADDVFGTHDDGLLLTPTSKVNGLVDIMTLPRDFIDILGSSRTFYADIGAYEYYLGTNAPVIYVDAGASGGDGSSWGNAFNDLHAALTEAGTGGVAREIWVKKGNYMPHANNRGISFNLPPMTSMFGGFNGTESKRYERNVEADTVQLSGEIGMPGFPYDNSFHVVKFLGNGLIDGFTIGNGFADGTGNDSKGGGIYAPNANSYIQNCQIFDCGAAEDGGGVYTFSSSLFEVTFANCFSGNDAGGAFLGGSELEGCVFVLCDAGNDGGAAHSEGGPSRDISESTFVMCSASDEGGSLKVNGIEIEGNYFINSKVGAFGGAIFAENSTIERNIFSHCFAASGNANAIGKSSSSNLMDNIFIGIPDPVATIAE